MKGSSRFTTMAVARQQTLKELAAPNVENQPLCINIEIISTSSSSLVLYIYCQYSMDFPEKILIVISRSSTSFVLA
jgi:hypothetical protein